MKRIVSTTLALVLSLSLAACGGDTAQETPADTRETTTEQQASPAGEGYTEQEIPVLRESLESTETAHVRLYEDVPGVPYMSAAAFYNQFYLMGTDLTEGMSCERSGDTYTLTNLFGDTATIDVAADTITIDDVDRFTDSIYDLQVTDTGGVDPDYPFAKISHELTPETATPKTLALADYGIDLKGDEAGAYVPVQTLSDLFATTSAYYVVYSGQKLYVKDFLGNFQDGSVMEEDPDYLTAVEAERSEDEARFAYNELCLNMDMWYGKPGKEYVHDAYQEGVTLDSLLTDQYPEIKEKLLAGDFETYYEGLQHLVFGLLFDGGHTMMGSDVVQSENIDLARATIKDIRQREYGALYNQVVERQEEGPLRLEAREALYAGETYAEQGDTAIVCIDEFYVDNKGWKDFYAGEGERPGDDTVGIILDALERARQNPEIRNFIIDVSCDHGGDDTGVLAIEWLTLGENYIRDDDATTQRINKKSMDFDMNFDGSFDESDVSPFTGLRYGVLTSSESFSSANAFTWFMHEHGAMILGEQSGGGACAIRMTSARGVEVNNSAASSRTITDEGGTVDFGCPVDADLTGEGENPYEGFYDLGTLSQKMNELFDGAQESAA